MTPGSPEAVKAGCTCAVMDNHHGEGVPMRDGKRGFYLNADCPLHGTAGVIAEYSPQPKEAAP